MEHELRHIFFLKEFYIQSILVGLITSLACQIGDLLSSRERLGTTGLGGGIALPHARIAKKEPARAAFLKISNPIDFDAIDEKPVDLFLGLCLPEDSINEYLNLLGKVAEAFEDITLVENLRVSNDKEAVLRRLSGQIDSKGV